MTELEFQERVLLKLTKLDVELTGLKLQLVGNGQPGRIPKLEGRVRWIERIAWSLAGAWTLFVVWLSHLRGK